VSQINSWILSRIAFWHEHLNQIWKRSYRTVKIDEKSVFSIAVIMYEFALLALCSKYCSDHNETRRMHVWAIISDGNRLIYVVLTALFLFNYGKESYSESSNSWGAQYWKYAAQSIEPSQPHAHSARCTDIDSTVQYSDLLLFDLSTLYRTV
jgi:hypothetical protein